MRKLMKRILRMRMLIDLERSEDSDEENDKEEENQEVEMVKKQTQRDPNGFTRSNSKLFRSNLDSSLLDMVDFCLYDVEKPDKDPDKPNNRMHSRKLSLTEISMIPS